MSEIRLRKVESLLKSEIGSIFLKQEIKDPRINNLLTIAGVKISGDLKYATVYISSFISQNEVETEVKVLNHAAGYIQKLLGKRLRLRFIPKLNFVSDNSIEQGFNLIQKMREMKS